MDLPLNDPPRLMVPSSGTSIRVSSAIYQAQLILLTTLPVYPCVMENGESRVRKRLAVQT